ncbi:MAG TPA: leucine-rich repeat domain-containing protein, partial [Candidatus Deferrimicrobium sp.]|nr:leucine-rich repeat domain-containing protein [Candidatus Deferrimicrobium sp.]
YNQLTTLPASFGHLKSLKELRISSNQLTTLPESFRNLSNLQTLVIRGNPLDSRARGIIKDLEKRGLSVTI